MTREEHGRLLNLLEQLRGCLEYSADTKERLDDVAVVRKVVRLVEREVVAASRVAGMQKVGSD